MQNYEKTFIRGHSPTYTEEITSVNAMSRPVETMESIFTNKEAKLDSFGTQGRKTFAFWTIVVVLFILSAANLILTLTITGVLQLGKGIKGMELIPEEGAIKFYGLTDLDRIYSKSIGQIEGFLNEPVTITGNEGVYVRLPRNSQQNNRLLMDDAGIQFRSVNTFEVKDANNGDTIFTTHRPHYNMPEGADNLIAKTASSSRIVSPIGQGLRIDVEDRMALRGSEGVLLDGFGMFVQAEHNVLINSTQSTILEGTGVFLNMDKIPIVSSELGLRTGSISYKLCVCMPQGLLFRISIPRIHNGPKITCAHVSPQNDPCSLY